MNVSRIESTIRALTCMAIWLSISTGCTTVRNTDPPRTATEQFLISTATIHAVSQLSVDSLRGRSVFIDNSNMQVIDQTFIIGELRSHLLLSGVRLAEKRDEAEAIVEVRSGGSGIDRYEFLLGIPSFPLGAATSAASNLPATPIITPELALIKNSRQWGFTSVAITAYWRDSGEIIAASGPFVGRSRREDWWFFGTGPTVESDIPSAKPLEK